jgi:hypothetical protein
MNFKHYQRKGLSEMISVSEFIANGGDMTKVSIADVDKKLLTTDFQQGFIARNPKNHEDLWYVAKKYFDDNLQPAFDITINLTFGQAIRALKQGKKVARQGWNGKSMFLFLLPAGTVPTKAIHDPALRKVIETEIGGETFEALGSIRMFTADKKILTGWLASQTDILAEDWVVLD